MAGGLIAAALLSAVNVFGAAANFSVTSPGFFYNINNVGPNPTITLQRGRTYSFAVNTDSFHPFQILAAGTFSNNVNNISSGIIHYTVPTNAPATINPGYRCSIHNFTGIILTEDPPPPPPVAIVGFAFSNNVVLRSTGANGATLVPEFKTNLNNTNWVALTILSNRFSNGTNETFCGRPPGTNVFIRIRNP